MLGEHRDDSGADSGLQTRRAVRETYDRIASHFARTRPRPWPEVESFLEGRRGAVGLDIGIGNGRHAELLGDRCNRVVGFDVSLGALDQAARRSERHAFEVDLVAGDASALPLADGAVELAVYVATVHHLPTQGGRRASLDELARVLAPDGRGLVTAWCVTHDRFEATAGFDTTVDWTLPGGETVERYYHIYDMEEFRADLRESRLAVRSSFESRGNCVAVVGRQQ